MGFDDRIYGYLSVFMRYDRIYGFDRMLVG